jgi:plasmid stability protein
VSETGRLQLDIRDVPIETIAALRLRAFAEHSNVTAVCRSILIEGAKPDELADDVVRMEPAPWGTQ